MFLIKFKTSQILLIGLDLIFNEENIYSELYIVYNQFDPVTLNVNLKFKEKFPDTLDYSELAPFNLWTCWRKSSMSKWVSKYNTWSHGISKIGF